LIFLLSLLAAGLAFKLYNNIDKELLPSEDRGNIRVFARGPDGVGISYMDRQAKEMEDILLPYAELGDIDSIRTVVGSWDPNIVYMTINLKDWAERKNSQQEIINDVRPKLANIPGAPARAYGSNSLNLRGQGGGLEFAITGNDYEDIFDVTQAFSKVVEASYPEFGLLDISYQPTQPQMRVHIDRNRAEELGVPFSDINQTLRAAIGGDDLTDLNVGDKAVPIILQSSYKDSANPSDLTNLYVAAKNGDLVSLSSIAYISEEGVAAELERHAQRRAIEIDAELPESMSIAEAVTVLRQLARDNLPNGYDLVLLGEAKTYQETDQQVMMT
jgi:multidrug efflux pump subunit AcrB